MDKLWAGAWQQHSCALSSCKPLAELFDVTVRADLFCFSTLSACPDVSGDKKESCLHSSLVFFFFVFWDVIKSCFWWVLGSSNWRKQALAGVKGKEKNLLGVMSTWFSQQIKQKDPTGLVLWNWEFCSDSSLPVLRMFKGEEERWPCNAHLFSSTLSFLLYVGTCKYIHTQSCPTLCDPMDSSLPGSSVRVRIFQARILEWVVISFSSGFSQPTDQVRVSLWQVDSLPLCHLGSPRMGT